MPEQLVAIMPTVASKLAGLGVGAAGQPLMAPPHSQLCL